MRKKRFSQLRGMRLNYIPPAKLSAPLAPREFSEKLTLDYIDQMNPYEFESLVAELLRSRGYTAQLTPSSGDYGVDVIASRNKERIAVQVKKYGGKVSLEAIQQAVAGCPFYNCTAAMVVTNSHFTDRARRYAREISKQIECTLVNRRELQEWLTEYRLEQSPKFGDKLRLQYVRHRLLVKLVVGIALLVALFLLFERPLCKILC